MAKQRRGEQGTKPPTLVLDASAIISATKPNPNKRVLAILEQALENDAPLAIASVTLAEVLRGERRDAPVYRLINAANVIPIDAQIGRQAGERIGRKRASGNMTIDALVAEAAVSVEGIAIIVTSDADDFLSLVDRDVRVITI